MKYICTAPCGQRPCESNRPESEYKGCDNYCPLFLEHEWKEKGTMSNDNQSIQKEHEP